VIEVDLADRGGGARAVRHHALDARPGLQGLLLVAGLVVAIAEIDEVAAGRLRRRPRALQDLEGAVLLVDALVEIGHRGEDLVVVRCAPRAR
jgi:hypothetical protein